MIDRSVGRSANPDVDWG